MSNEALGWTYRHSPYRGATFQAHCAIADSVNDQHDNEFWMAAGNLAKKARIVDSSAREALAQLEADGYLIALDAPGVAKAAGRPGRYRFVFLDAAEVVWNSRGRRSPATPPGDVDPEGRQPPATGSPTTGDRGRRPPATNPRTNPREPQDARAGATRPAESDDPESDAPKLAPFEFDFNRAWKFYPRKEARKAALKQYQRLRRAGVDPAELHKATQVYAYVVNATGRTKMLGSTFFGPGERWPDFLDRDAAMARERPPDSRFGAPPSGRPQPKTQSRCPTCDELEIDCRCPQAAAS